MHFLSLVKLTTNPLFVEACKGSGFILLTILVYTFKNTFVLKKDVIMGQDKKWLEEQFEKINGEIKAVKSEMSSEFAAVRSEMTSEFAAVRIEMSSEFAAFRSEMTSEFAAVRTEMTSEFAPVRSEATANFATLDQKISVVDTKVDALRADFNGFAKRVDKTLEKHSLMLIEHDKTLAVQTKP
jgi:hypothetical protein